MITALPNDDQVEKAVNLLAALSNPKRLMIMKLLIEGEVSVGTLALEVDLSQSALSQHLAKLREGGFVTTRRDAQTIYYSSRSEAVAKVLRVLEDLAGSSSTSSRNVAKARRA